MSNQKNTIQNSTYPPKCYWCGEYGEVRFLKISITKEKPACLSCYKMMTVKPEIPMFPTEMMSNWKYIK